MKQGWTYRAKAIRVVDGDTIDFDVDLGFYMTARIRVRLRFVDTPELRSREYWEREAAQRAKRFVEDWLPDDGVVTLYTFKADSFGRWLGDVLYDMSDLSNDLISSGHGEPYVD